jgi:serine/threonine protein kinase
MPESYPMRGATSHPERLGRFEIVGALARGRTGEVYKAVDPVHRRTVSLKTVPLQRLEKYGPDAVKLFESEARAAVKLQHPAIVPVYEYGEDNGFAFIATEYIEGSGLKEQTRISVADAASLITQLLAALDYAHEHGVVHLEIQPSNLLLTDGGVLRITDFGITKLEPANACYMSPEQFMGRPADRRSDVFSAGIVLYELLTGVAPFAGPAETLVARVCDHRQSETPVSLVNTQVPSSFDSVCAKALAKAVYDRYATARAFSDAVASAFWAGLGTNISPVVSSGGIGVLAGAPAKPVREPSRAPAKSASAPVIERRPITPPPVKVLPATTQKADAPKAPLAPKSSVQSEIKVPNIESRAVAKPILGPPAPSTQPSPDSKVPAKPADETTSLADFLKESPAQMQTVLSPFARILEALSAMYETNHKNAILFPQNIRFDRRGKVSIRVQEASSQSDATMLGVPRYAAPELFTEKAKGDDKTVAGTHIYSLGFMFYEILLGKNLFATTFPNQHSDLDWLRWHSELENKAPAAKTLLPECPAALSDLIESMMEKRADKRTTDLSALRSGILSVAQRANRTVVMVSPQSGAESPAAGSPSTKSKPAAKSNLLLLLILATVGGLSVLFVIYFSHLLK